MSIPGCAASVASVRSARDPCIACPQKLPASIVRVWLAGHEACAFETVHYTCDGARRQTSEDSEIASGQWTRLAQEVETLMVCRIETEPFSNGVMKHQRIWRTPVLALVCSGCAALVHVAAY